MIPFLCEKSGAILLVLVGLTAGIPAVKQNTGRFGNFQKFSMDCIVRIFMAFNEGTCSVIIVLPMDFSQ